MLEGSRAKIEHNNIINNGGWEVKVLDDKGQVKAPKNWWGTEDPIKNEILGPVAVTPTLKSPIAFTVLEE